MGSSPLVLCGPVSVSDVAGGRSAGYSRSIALLSLTSISSFVSSHTKHNCPLVFSTAQSTSGAGLGPYRHIRQGSNWLRTPACLLPLRGQYSPAIMSAPPAQALATHLLNQTLASIALLEQLSLISSSDAHTIRSRLPSPTGPFPSLNPSPDLSSSFGGLSVAPSSSFGHQQQQPLTSSGWQSSPPAPGPPALPPRGRPEQRARALWDYNGVVGSRGGCDGALTDGRNKTICLSGKAIP
jgi:hypothetical protein